MVRREEVDGLAHLGQHVGAEQLRRRARLIQDLMQTAGPLIGVAVTAIGSLYAGLKGILG